jgi:L-alanine-DL-glutamate epimerase-like enolase superfamily enzyme
MPLWALWGGADVRERETDVTLPIAQLDETLAHAARWHAQGFRVFKLKVGADGDLARARGVADAHPDAEFVLDANQAWSETEAVAFVRDLGALKSRVRLLEQPVAREDLDAMAALRRSGGVAVAADEAVFTRADARRVIERRAADVINLKIMKSGLAETLAIAELSRASGVGLMVGGMVETRLAMSFSYAIALGLGGVAHIDLDTPLFLAEDPVVGGYAYAGPRMTVWRESGVGAIPHATGRSAA